MNLSNYLKEIAKELRLTTFPTQNVVINFTIFVILFTAVMAAFLGLLDLVFGKAILGGIAYLRESNFVLGLHAKNIVETSTSTINSIIGTTTQK